MTLWNTEAFLTGGTVGLPETFLSEGTQYRTAELVSLLSSAHLPAASARTPRSFKN